MASSYDIASPLHYQVLQRIEKERQFNVQGSDSTYARLRVVSGYSPRVFVADVEESDLAGDSNVLDLSLGYYRAPRQR